MSSPFRRIGWGFLPLPGERRFLANSERQLHDLVDYARSEREPEGLQEDVSDIEAPAGVIPLAARRQVSGGMRAEVSWRRIAGPEELEPVVLRLDTPPEILEATAGIVAERMRVFVDGPPSGFSGVRITLDVSGRLAGRLYVLDSLGSATEFVLGEDQLVGTLSRASLVPLPARDGPEIYDAVFRLVWVPLIREDD